MAWWGVALGVGATYVGTSLFLLHRPWERKKRLAFHCPHISHRGGAGEAIENTMSAFERAEAVGTHMLEIDCQLTSDGVVVVSHDDDLSRVAGEETHISGTLFDHLPLLLQTLPLQFDPDMLYESKADPQSIVTLEEVFKRFPLMPINIDIKVENQELVDKVSNLVKKYKREHLCCWGNFSDDTCRRCYETNPSIPLLFSLRRVVLVYVAFYLGLLPFLPIKESCLEIIMPTLMLKSERFNTTATRRLLIRFIDVFLMRPALFRHLQRRGIHVYLWVLNREEDFRRARSLGVDGIMTDYPTKLTSFYEKEK